MSVHVNGASASGLSDAVRELRWSHQQTQQVFATRLGIAIASVAHYEGGQRSPDLRALLKFYGAARASGRSDLAKQFADLVNKEVGFKVVRP